MLTEEVPQKHWETDSMRWKWMERQMYELGALVRGLVPAHAERIAGLVEEIDALRKEVSALTARIDKASEVFKSHVKKENGGGT